MFGRAKRIPRLLIRARITETDFIVHGSRGGAGRGVIHGGTDEDDLSEETST